MMTLMTWVAFKCQPLLLFYYILVIISPISIDIHPIVDLFLKGERPKDPCDVLHKVKYSLFWQFSRRRIPSGKEKANYFWDNLLPAWWGPPAALRATAWCRRASQDCPLLQTSYCCPSWIHCPCWIHFNPSLLQASWCRRPRWIHLEVLPYQLDNLNSLWSHFWQANVIYRFAWVPSLSSAIPNQPHVRVHIVNISSLATLNYAIL